MGLLLGQQFLPKYCSSATGAADSELSPPAKGAQGFNIHEQISEKE